MDSRDRVLAALNHKEPDRVPIDFAGTGVTTICYRAYNDLVKYLGFNFEEYQPEDLGAGAWAGVVAPHIEVYDRLRSDVMMVGMGQPDAWELDIQYGDENDTYVDEWGTTVVRPKGGHYFDYRIFPVQEGTVEAFKKWNYWPDPNDSRTLARLSRTLLAGARHRTRDHLLLGFWGRHIRTTRQDHANGRIPDGHCFGSTILRYGSGQDVRYLL